MSPMDRGGWGGEQNKTDEKLFTIECRRANHADPMKKRFPNSSPELRQLLQIYIYRF